MASERQARIRERAYAIWVESGHPEGADHDHWLKAESEIAAGGTKETAVAGAQISKAPAGKKTKAGAVAEVAASDGKPDAKSQAKTSGKRPAKARP